MIKNEKNGLLMDFIEDEKRRSENIELRFVFTFVLFIAVVAVIIL